MSDNTATTQNDLAAELRRLYLLKTLKVSAGYRASIDLLKLALQNIGHSASTAVIRADVAKLEQLGLVSSSPIGEMVIVLLRDEGVDAADGVSFYPGVVARPAPEH